MIQTLLIDDDRSFSALAAAALQREGFPVSVARSLHEAREAIAREAPALIILDRRLPDGDGLAFLPELGPALRALPAPEIIIDFKPAHTVGQLVKKLGNCPRNFLAEARSRWRLSDAAFAILENLPGRAPFTSAVSLAATVKSCAATLRGFATW